MHKEKHKKSIFLPHFASLEDTDIYLATDKQMKDLYC